MENASKYYLEQILKPIIAFALKHGIGIQEFSELSKIIYVNVSSEELKRENSKITSSKISVMTGIRRPEIKKILNEDTSLLAHNLVSRVLTQWEQDSEFTTKAGKPRVLKFAEMGDEFNRLVSKVSTDLHPASILFELERRKLVEKTPKGLSLLERKHVSIEDAKTGFSMLTEDISLLINTVEKNVLSEQNVKELHAKTVFDNIYKEDIDTIKKWLLAEGAKFHNKIRNYLASFDKDIKVQESKTPGAKVSFCTFSSTEGNIK